MITFELPKIEVSHALLSHMSPPPKTLVELGTYIGNSAVGWGHMLSQLHPNATARESVKVYAVELNAEFAGMARDLVRLAGLSDVVTVLQGASADHLRGLRGEHGVDTIDVLFLDHWKDCYLPDLRLCEDLGLLRVGTLVLADNTDFPGVPDYVAYVNAGGREDGAGVRYETRAHDTVAEKGHPSIVLASTVVKLP